jgi:hypothetical protein
MLEFLRLNLFLTKKCHIQYKGIDGSIDSNFKTSHPIDDWNANSNYEINDSYHVIFITSTIIIE